MYNYTDHLGNIRLSYSDSNNDGKIADYFKYITHCREPINGMNMCQEIGREFSEILNSDDYYPFGMKHVKMSFQQENLFTKNNYKYNGKELQDELSLNLYDYGARNYDPAIGRWFNVDPFAAKYKNNSPYTYTLNNPVYFIDPNGKEIKIGENIYSYQENRDYSTIENEFEREAYMSLDYLYSKGAMKITIGEGDDSKKVNVLQALIDSDITINMLESNNGNTYNDNTKN